MKMTKALFSVLISVIIILPVFGCTSKEDYTVSQLESIKPIDTESESTAVSATEADSASQAASIDTYVILNDESTTINGDGATFENNVLSITAPGTYSIKGKLSDGHIVVNSASTDKKVKLYFDGVDIYCSDTAPVYVEESGKETIIILADGSVNSLSDNADRAVPENEDTEYATAVIYSKDDLQLEGGGTLNISANFNKGIFSKDDLQIRGGIINITSADDAVRGKDSVEISGGTLNLTSGGDGIRTSNETDSDKGDMLISGGTINITSELDAIQAVGALTITGGSITAKAGGGSSEITETREAQAGRLFGSMPGARPGDSSSAEAADDTTSSTKAIKGKSISITGGEFNLDSYDDAVHSNSALYVTGGSFTVKTNDDAFHCETELKLSDANIRVLQSYEGLEGESISITSGTIYITSADDGINAASGTEQSENPAAPWAKTAASVSTSSTPAPTNVGMGGRGGMKGNGGMGGGAMGEYNSANTVNISGGVITVIAEGDGIDSNGDISISGGSVYVFGPESSGNGSLDYAGSCTVTGGTLLAAGSSGMAQGVSGGSAASISVSCSVPGNTLFTIEDSNGEEVICFVSPKRFSCVIFAGDMLTHGEVYKAYTGGSHSGEAENGVYISGEYTEGTLLGEYTAQ